MAKAGNSSLHVRQVNMRTGIIRLDVGTTKNMEGREVTMTKTIRELALLAVARKNPDDYLLTREDGKPVKDFRKGWQNVCIKAGLGRSVCIMRKHHHGREMRVRKRKVEICWTHHPRFPAFSRAENFAERVFPNPRSWTWADGRRARMFRRYAITDHEGY